MLKVNITEDTWKCKACEKDLPLDQFYVFTNGHIYPRCKACTAMFHKERKAANKAGRLLDKSGKPKEVTKRSKAVTKAHAGYMAEVTKSATTMVTNLRDAAFNMAEVLSKVHDVEKLEIKNAYQLSIALKTLNEIVLTNSCFLKSNIDLSGLSDTELLQLAEAMTAKTENNKAKDEAVDVEVES
jgi:hypothetical protein